MKFQTVYACVIQAFLEMRVLLKYKIHGCVTNTFSMCSPSFHIAVIYLLLSTPSSSMINHRDTSGPGSLTPEQNVSRAELPLLNSSNQVSLG